MVCHEGDANKVEGRAAKLALFAEGLKLYRDRKWHAAEGKFAEAAALDDGPAAVFAERCRYHHEHGVPTDWQGVNVMKTK